MVPSAGPSRCHPATLRAVQGTSCCTAGGPSPWVRHSHTPDFDGMAAQCGRLNQGVAGSCASEDCGNCLNRSTCVWQAPQWHLSARRVTHTQQPASRLLLVVQQYGPALWLGKSSEVRRLHVMTFMRTLSQLKHTPKVCCELPYPLSRDFRRAIAADQLWG